MQQTWYSVPTLSETIIYSRRCFVCDMRYVFRRHTTINVAIFIFNHWYYLFNLCFMGSTKGKIMKKKSPKVVTKKKGKKVVKKKKQIIQSTTEPPPGSTVPPPPKS